MHTPAQRVTVMTSKEGVLPMTCYQRHLDWLFEALDLPYDRDGRRRLDTALREILALGPDAHCPEVWAAFKAVSEAEMASLVPRLREALDDTPAG
jgi:hypothetical protein